MMAAENTGEEHIRNEELIALYGLLQRNQDELSVRLIALLYRIERRLFDRLSIEEIESIPDLGQTAVDELSKKL